MTTASPSILATVTDFRLADRAEDPEAWFAERFVLFAQLAFRERKTGDHHWSEDEEETEILITDEVPVPQSAIDQKPAVQLVVATNRNQGLALDHLLTWDWRTGKRTHMDLVSGQASFNVHAKNGDESRRLARFIKDRILTERRILMWLAVLHDTGRTPTMGPTSPPGAFVSGGPEVNSRMTSVMFPFFFQQKWEATPLLIPIGQADPKAHGITRKEGVDLEEPSPVREINVDARILRAGVVSTSEDGLKQIYGVPISPPQIWGRTVTTIRRLDEIETEVAKTSPHVKASATSDEE